MSAAHWGRSTQSPIDYQAARLEAERRDLRRSNEALQQEARRLRGRVEDLRSDVREAARSQARLEARQQAAEGMIHRVESRQEEFERRAKRREQELRQEIQGVETRLGQEIEHLAEVTSREIGAVRSEVRHLRQDMDREIREVRHEVQKTREHLDKKIDGVRNDLQRQVDEVRAEIRAKETRRSAEAEELVRWVEARTAGLQNLEGLDLAIEETRIRETLRLTRERLSGKDPELALPTAEGAVGMYQTAHLERERRLGVIAGSADHVEEVAAEIERRARGEELQRIFPGEVQRLQGAAAELRARAGQWRTRPHWNSFDVERQEIFDRAHRLSSLSLELEAIVPTVTERLKEREQRLREAAAVATEVLGLVDRFETTYANPTDPKSPRLLRAFVGRIHLDAHLDLDGTYSYETYGFDSADECESTSRRVGQKLADRWQVASSHFDPSNPQRPTIQLPPTSESWREVASEVHSVSEPLMAGSRL